MSSYLGSKYVRFIRTVKYGWTCHSHDYSSRGVCLYALQGFFTKYTKNDLVETTSSCLSM